MPKSHSARSRSPRLMIHIERISAKATVAAIGLMVVMFVLTAFAHAQNTYLFPGPYRSQDGRGNNSKHPKWGSAGTDLFRPEGAFYADGISAPAGPDRPSPRLISNDVVAQSGDKFNPVGASDYLWQWGQFIDHDIALTNNDAGVDELDIPVPECDPYFDPTCTGTQVISFSRSHYDHNTGTSTSNPRQQIDENTSFIDGSQVYGSSLKRDTLLRAHDGTGHLLYTVSSVGNLLPYNVNNLPNACANNPDPTSCFFAGDIRSSEQLGLTAVQTLFMREHNRLCDLIKSEDPSLTDDQIFQNARAIVGAEIQKITYSEFLPILLGKPLPAYSGYNANMNPTMRNMFSGAAYRLGHTLLSPQLLRLDSNLQVIPQGNIALRDAFFNPQEIINGSGIEPLLRGLANQQAQNLDIYVIDDVRDFLFGDPGSGGLDLASLNLQRGRDHGLPSYNQARAFVGLPQATSFSDISSDPDVQSRLQTAYGTVDKVDLWIGALAEDHLPGALVGPLLRRILTTQFTALRDGDSFWYENIFSGDLLSFVENRTLAQVIRDNTTIGSELQDDVFHVVSGNARHGKTKK